MPPRAKTRRPRHVSPGADQPDRPPEPLGERLQKVLAAAGVGSRRECETLIEEGRVEVDRRVVTRLGTRVDPASQEIRVDGEPLARPKLVYYMLHKPAGVVSTSRDPSGRLQVTDLVPPSAGRLFSVGRLDMSSEGLILLTNDGELANQLTHPRYGVEKTYHVQVAGHLEPEVLGQLKRGVHLAEGFARAEHVRIKSRRKQSTVLEMVLAEGRNREVRRLLARVGHKVQRLVRVAVGPVRLGDLPPGAHRPLERREVQALRRAAGTGGAPPHRKKKKSTTPSRSAPKKKTAARGKPAAGKKTKRKGRRR